MVEKESLNNRSEWTEDNVQNYDEFIIKHNNYPIEIVVEETGSNAEDGEDWEAWLNVKKDSFEEEVPALLFDKTFKYKKNAMHFAREMAYRGGIEQRLDDC